VVRLTGTERAVAELAAIAEHVASLTTAAAAFQLRPDTPPESGDAKGVALVPLLDELVKGCAALAVAEFRQSAYWIVYLTRFLRTRCGLANRGVVELAGAVMHYVSFNTIAHAMRLEPPFENMRAADVAPGGRFEHLLPGGRPSSGASASKPA